MTAQEFAVIGMIALAGAYIARATLRTWFRSGKSGCGSGCGKCATKTKEESSKGRRSLPQI